jgi:phosphate transport system permease protein
MSRINPRLLSARDGRRKLFNWLMVAFLFSMALVAIAPLLNIFVYVIRQGGPALSWEFLTSLPKPVGETGGGMGHAVLGTAMMVGLASALGIPLGIAAGVFLSEYGNGKLARTLRFANDILVSVPSIIIGLFAYAIIVKPMGRFSALAGGFSLAVIMVPVIANTAEELLRLVPVHIREAGLALGIPRWKVILRIVLRGSLPGITAGIMLAVARAAGETAPLLITALNSRFWPRGLDQPMASIPVQIYNFAISPYEDWHKQAWAGALLLVGLVFLLNLGTRIFLPSGPATKD